jgi:TrmH family RNA methyltransferase
MVKNMEIITSNQNDLIKKVRLLQQTKHRHDLGLFIAEGHRTLKTLVTNNFKPVHMFCTKDLIEDAHQLAPTQSIIQVSDQLMESIAPSVSPSGLLGVFNTPANPPLNKLTSGVVLANINDPGNMGTLIRTTAAMGFRSVVCIEGTDPWGSKVIQSSVGTIGSVKIFRMDWKTLIENKKNLFLTALVVENGISPAAITKKNSLLVVGSEAHGIPDAWVKQCDQKVTIPMPGKTESLNAAVAGSIALYLLAQP